METINDLNSDRLPLKAIIRRQNATLMPNKQYWDHSKVNWNEFQTNLQQKVKINRDLDTRRKIAEAINEIAQNI